MASSLVSWVIVALIVGVVIILGAIILPIIVPVMTDYLDSSSSTTSTGTPFLQLLASWWPLFLPLLIVFGIVVFVLSHRNTP